MFNRRRKDPKPGDSGQYDRLSPEAKAAAFDMQYSRSQKRAAKKAAKKKEK